MYNSQSYAELIFKSKMVLAAFAADEICTDENREQYIGILLLFNAVKREYDIGREEAQQQMLALDALLNEFSYWYIGSTASTTYFPLGGGTVIISVGGLSQDEIQVIINNYLQANFNDILNGVTTVYEELEYSPVMSIRYEDLLPNKKIKLSGDVVINVLDTQNLDSGEFYIIRGSESVLFNGSVSGSTPLYGSFKIQYENNGGSLVWYYN